MKNLNKKISVIALSGMAVFGGIAASVVPAFAAQKGIELADEISGPDIDELNREIDNAGFSYRVLSKGYQNKQDAKNKMIELYSNSSRLNRNPASFRNSKFLRKQLQKFAELGNRVFVLGYKGSWYIVGLQDLL